MKNSQTKTYLYDGLDMLKDGSSTFLNGVGIDEPLSITNGGTTQTYLGDHLGSVDWLASSTGAFQTRYDYTSYGKLEGGLPNPSTVNNLSYTAREDDGTGLMFYRARYYDPGLERFISDDPLGDAQRYVGGNPVGWVDPLGLETGAVSFQSSKHLIKKRYGNGNGSVPRGMVCFSECIKQRDPVFNNEYLNAAPGAALTGAGGTFPKSWIGVGTFMGSSPNTTIPSATGFLLKDSISREAAMGLRSMGRVFSPLFVGYGYYLAIQETRCAVECANDACAYSPK